MQTPGGQNLSEHLYMFFASISGFGDIIGKPISVLSRDKEDHKMRDTGCISHIEK